MTIGLVFSFNIIMLLLCSLFSAAKSSRVFNAVFLIISSIITAVYAVQRDFNYGDTGNYVNFYQFEYIYKI